MDEKEIKKITDGYHKQTSRYRHQIKELSDENKRLADTIEELKELLKHSQSADIVAKNLRIANLESRIKDLEHLEQEVTSYFDTLNMLRANIKELTIEIEKKDKVIAELRGKKGNLRGAGRKRIQDLWKEKIFSCWRSGMKDKEIYGWLTCTDEKGGFHILSQATYYRIKAKYYDSGEWKQEN